MVKNHLKKLNNCRIWIQIQIFTKIESFCPCRTPCLPTKFRRNPSPTWDIVQFMVFSLNGEESLKQFLGFEFGSSPQLIVAVLGRWPTYTKKFRTIAWKLRPKIMWPTDRQTRQTTILGKKIFCLVTNYCDLFVVKSFTSSQNPSIRHNSIRCHESGDLLSPFLWSLNNYNV